MARAAGLLAPGGRIVVAVSNADGARASEADLASLAGSVDTLSKHKCRVFWTAPFAGQFDNALAAQWRELDTVQRIEDARFVSRPGVFAWDRIDPASQLLANQLPKELQGRAADLGAGFGYLSVELLQRCPGITALDVYEAEQRALELAQQNLQPYADKVQLGFHWHDVTAGLPQSYDVIVTNPPFHTHHGAEKLDIGRRFIAVAAAALKPGGSLWLVANRHLPYEQILDASFGRVRMVKQEQGFKIIEAVRMVAATPLRRRRP
jgi:16S rRNA (guanine1207-N2)-methyltransferase